MKIIFSLLFCFGLLPSIVAQIDFSADSMLLDGYYAKNITYQSVKNNRNLHFRNKTGLKLVLNLYKEALSEQISASCEFSPSCSSFSWLALDEFGVIKALLLTADRLTRCNGNAQTESFPYLIRSDDIKILDNPVQYRINK